MRRLGDSNRPLRRELSSTLAVGLVEYERNMDERANRAEVTSALKAVAANNAQLVAQEYIAFEQRDRALRQTVREEFDGYRAHLAIEMQEDIPAHVEARIADVCDFFRGQFNEGARRVERPVEMFAVALREEAHRELISVEGSSASRQARVQEELVRARHGEVYSVGLWKTEMANARAQAATEQEVAVARCRSSAAAALDNARAHAENHCERLEEGFARERDRAAVADLVLADMAAQLRDEQAMVSELRDTALGMQAQVDEFVEQYAESTKRVIDRECPDVKKHERDLVENAEALAWHEESVVTELRLELQQARMQVARCSGLAEQQQRQLESDTVEPLLECLGTLTMKAVSDPFRERSLVCEPSMPAAPEQAQGGCGPETPVADVCVEAARWAIPAHRDVNIADEDSSEESSGEETDRRRAVVKRQHKTLEVCSRKWERFDAELPAACFRFAPGEVLRRLKMYRDTVQWRGLDVSGRAAFVVCLAEVCC